MQRGEFQTSLIHLSSRRLSVNILIDRVETLAPELELVESRVIVPVKEIQDICKKIRKTTVKRDHKVRASSIRQDGGKCCVVVCCGVESGWDGFGWVMDAWLGSRESKAGIVSNGMTDSFIFPFSSSLMAGIDIISW